MSRSSGAGITRRDGGRVAGPGSGGGEPGPEPGQPARDGAFAHGQPADRERDSSRAGQLERRLPPGQYVPASRPVLHYGPVPAFNPQTWDLRVYGATEAGQEHRWTWDGFRALPSTEIVADFHCVTKFTVLGLTWAGVPAAEILRAVPPAAPVDARDGLGRLRLRRQPAARRLRRQPTRSSPPTATGRS